MAAPLVILGIGTAIAAYGQIKQGQEQADAANQAAALRDQEAAQVRAKLEINRQALLRQGVMARSSQVLAYSASGVDLSGSVLTQLENTNEQVARSIFNAKTDAEFNANQLATEGNLMRQKGQEALQAGYYGAASSVLTAGYSYFSPRGKI